MDYKDIKKLMDDMGNSKLDEIEIEFPEGVKISMKKNTKKEVIIAPQGQNVIEASAPMTPPARAERQEQALVNTSNINNQENLQNVETKEENYKTVKSPMVGTFYASPSPDKDPFVKVGDKVHKGQVLCVIEAMKLMNEVESEFDGEVVEICVNNEDMVEYGTPLFKIK